MFNSVFLRYTREAFEPTTLGLFHRTLKYLVRGIITVRLTTWLTGWDSAALLVLNYIDIYKFGRIQTRQTGGQLYSDK